jgi:hypothetical protein
MLVESTVPLTVPKLIMLFGLFDGNFLKILGLKHW